MVNLSKGIGVCIALDTLNTLTMSAEGVTSMAEETPTADTQSATTKIYLYREGVDSTHVGVDTSCQTVGQLRAEMGLTGSISVRPEGEASIIANDSTPLTQNCSVNVVGGNKTGG